MKRTTRIAFSLVTLALVGMQFAVLPAIPARAISTADYYGPPASGTFTYSTNTTYFYNYTFKMTNTGAGLPLSIDRRIPTLSNRTMLDVTGLLYEQEFRITNQSWSPCTHNEVTDVHGNQYHEVNISSIGLTTWKFNVQGNLKLRDITWQAQTGVTMASYNKTDPLYTRYTKVEDQINKSFPLTYSAAVPLNNSNPFTTARNVYNFVAGYLTYNGSMTGDYGAEYAIVHHYGDCTEFSYLMVALLRACGIPARTVLGLVIANSAGSTVSPNYGAAVGTKWRYRFVSLDGNTNNVIDTTTGHAWVEYFIPGVGWILADPTWSGSGDFGAHIDNIHVPYSVGIPDGMGMIPYVFYIYDYLVQEVDYEFTVIQQELPPSLWDQFLDFIMKNPWVIYALVGLIAVVIVIYAIRKHKKNSSYLDSGSHRERVTFSS